MSDSQERLQYVMAKYENACAELAEKARQVDELAAALSEAVGWNWLDDDMPDHIYDKCHGALGSYNKTKAQQ